MSEARVERIRAALVGAFAPVEIRVEDQSHLHAGHVGARDGGGHFHVHIVAEGFVGVSRVARHRMVYGAVADQMGGEIHALAITALAPGEG